MAETAEKVIIYADGGARGNPGPAGAGVLITDEAGRPLKEAAKALPPMTNNEAEYQAVIFGLETLARMFGKAKTRQLQVEMRLDSELVARQLRGEYQIKEAKLFPWFIKIWNLRLAAFPQLTFVTIPREENQAADRLANRAMDQAAARGQQLFQ